MEKGGDPAGDSAATSEFGEPALRPLTQAEAAAEFETLADHIPTLCWMARAEGHIYWYNRRWYEYTGTSIDSQEGWGWETVHDPTVLPLVLERWKHSLGTGSEFEMTFPLKGADGTFRPFLTRVVPIRDPDGAIVRWFGTNTDVDELKRTEEQLRARGAELETLLSNAPIGLAYFDRNYRVQRINDELARISGIAAADHLGRTLSEVLPDGGPVVEPPIDQVFATGEEISGFEVAGQSPQSPGVVRHWLTGYFPVSNDKREVEAVGAWVVEITERKAAEQRELLLAREVDHRAKNLLAVVQSIVQLTPVADGAELKASIVGRIQALARAHSLLSDARWKGVVFGQLVRDELAPFGPEDGGRVSVEGPHLLLRPAAAQSLGLVLHELATNAAKYGALSNGSGTVRVAWRLDSGDGGGLLVIDWTESGGPDPGQPELNGFGSQIVRASIDRQLRGKVVKRWDPDGLRCTIQVPAAQVVPGSAE